MPRNPIRLEGLPSTYDPVAINSLLRTAFDDLSRTDLPPVTPVTQTGTWPRPETSNIIGLNYRTGALQTLADGRFAAATLTRNTGALGEIQRFRFPEGIELRPLFVGPTCAFAFIEALPAVASFNQVVWGRFVTGIPHSLARLPERVLWRGSADDRGPRGQRVIARDGSLLSGNVRCDVDFVPVFAQDRTDVFRFLKHFVPFAGGENRVDDTLAGGVLNNTNLEVADLADGLANELVTTATTFGGFLVTTAWGITAWAQVARQYDNAIFRESSIIVTGITVDPINGRPDPMLSAVLPYVGKSLYATPLVDDTFANYFANATRLVLTAGSVDFVMG
jgi:hypothetical protein